MLRWGIIALAVAKTPEKRDVHEQLAARNLGHQGSVRLGLESL